MDALLIALSLITGSPDEIPPNMSIYPGVPQTLIALGLDMQLLNHHEPETLFRCYYNWEYDIGTLTSRNYDLHNAPPMEDCERWLDLEFINEQIGFNRAFRECLSKRQAGDPDRNQHYWEIINEVDELYNIWTAARDVKMNFYPVTKRRDLKKLRELLGFEAYYKGILPPVVPLKYFRSVD